MKAPNCQPRERERESVKLPLHIFYRQLYPDSIKLITHITAMQLRSNDWRNRKTFCFWGADRLARTSGGDLEGLALTAQDRCYFLEQCIPEHPRTVSEVFFCRMRHLSISKTCWDCHWWFMLVKKCLSRCSLEQEVLMANDFPKATRPSIFSTSRATVKWWLGGLEIHLTKTGSMENHGNTVSIM